MKNNYYDRKITFEELLAIEELSITLNNSPFRKGEYHSWSNLPEIKTTEKLDKKMKRLSDLERDKDN